MFTAYYSCLASQTSFAGCYNYLQESIKNEHYIIGDVYKLITSISVYSHRGSQSLWSITFTCFLLPKHACLLPRQTLFLLM